MKYATASVTPTSTRCAFVYALDMDKLKPRREGFVVRKGGSGFGVNGGGVMYTLNTIDRNAVAVCRKER